MRLTSEEFDALAFYVGSLVIAAAVGAFVCWLVML